MIIHSVKVLELSVQLIRPVAGEQCDAFTVFTFYKPTYELKKSYFTAVLKRKISTAKATTDT